MHYLVIGDDGHGYDPVTGVATAGKRTPKFSDGTFMYENEFNHAVVEKMKPLFKNVSIEFYDVSPEMTDTPLTTRSSRANKVYNDAVKKYGKDNVKCIFISVHANAYLGTWGEWGGVSTFHDPGSVNGKKLATSVQKFLMNGTPLRNRGVKTDDFHVLRETLMPAILVECAFMDNLTEATLLRTDAYRQECAEEIFFGACEYLGVKAELPKPEVPKIMYRVIIDDKRIMSLSVYENAVQELKVRIEKGEGKSGIIQDTNGKDLFEYTKPVVITVKPDVTAILSGIDALSLNLAELKKKIQEIGR